MKKRAFAFLITLIMILTALPMPSAVAVEAAEAENLNSGYSSTLMNVLRRASHGDSIRLLGNLSISSTLTVSKSLTLDGNGYKVSYSGIDKAFSIGADTEMKNLTVSALQGNGIDVSAGAALTLTGTKVEVGDRYAISLVGNSAKVTVNSGGLKAPLYLIYAPGVADADVSIYGGSFETTAESDGVRMFQMTSGRWNFYGGYYFAKRGYVFNAASDPVMNVHGGSYVFTGSSENLWNIRDNSVANFYGGYFYTPNHGSPFLVRGDKNAVMNVYGGSYFCADTLPFSASGSGRLNEYGGSYFDIKHGIEIERFEQVGKVITQRFNIKPQRHVGASVRIDGESARLGFSTTVSKKVLDNVKAIADPGSVLSFGTLIIESEKLSGVVGFNRDILYNAGLYAGIDYLDIPATELTENADGSVSFGGSTLELDPEDYGHDFSAASYIKFKVGGNDVYSYSIFADGDTRNARDVAVRALADNDEQGDSLYTPDEVAVLERYVSDSYEYQADETMAARVVSLNILTHNLKGKESKYKLYGSQVPEDYDFGVRYNYVKALFEYTSPDVVLLQEYSGIDFWGQAITLNTTALSGVYTSPDFPGYTWVNHGNRRGVLYENNTIANMGSSDPFHAHNFVLFSSDKFEYLASATRFVSKTGTREVTGGNLGDNPGGGSYNDLGDYTWVALRDKATGIVSIYATIHTYNGDLQRYPYMLDNLQCVTEELERVSAEYGNAPVVLGGDFNMRNEHYLFHASYDHMTEVANYRDSKVTGDNSGTARVYGNNISGDDGASKFHARIDYIFANGADTYGYEVLDGQVEKRGEQYVYNPEPALDGTGYDISDHLPIMTDIVIGKNDSYKVADKDNYYVNPNTKYDAVSNVSGTSASKKDKLVFDSTDLLAYVENNGQYMEGKIVEDAECGEVLRIAATDETNYVNVAIDYKSLFGNVNISGYSKMTVKYRSELIIKNYGGANDIKIGISTDNTALKDGTLVAIDTTKIGEWTTVTVDISSLSGNINEIGIYGRSKLTGLFCGDAVYIESISFTN